MSIKALIRRVISRSVRHEFLWKVLEKTIVLVGELLRFERKQLTKPAMGVVTAGRAIEAISPDLVVKHGVFKGMRYPSRASVGSMLIPKLLGSYEREIQPLIEQLCQNEYTEIVDIGCAEGYYAVGLAMRIPSARVFAYDINVAAVRLCETMAHVNGVDDRVTVDSVCDCETLKNLPLTRKALIVSDCEGYERQLFTPITAPLFSRHDLLIETHDFVDIEISGAIREVFRETHDVKEYESLDDIFKAQTYHYEELEEYDLAMRRVLVAECRPAIMKWLYLTPAKSAQGL